MQVPPKQGQAVTKPLVENPVQLDQLAKIRLLTWHEHSQCKLWLVSAKFSKSFMLRSWIVSHMADGTDQSVTNTFVERFESFTIR